MITRKDYFSRNYYIELIVVCVALGVVCIMSPLDKVMTTIGWCMWGLAVLIRILAEVAYRRYRRTVEKHGDLWK